MVLLKPFLSYFLFQNVYCTLIFSKKVTGVLCDNGQIEKGDLFVLATGVMAHPMGRSIGVNLPIYPLKGNVVTIPLNVSKFKGVPALRISLLSSY